MDTRFGQLLTDLETLEPPPLLDFEPLPSIDSLPVLDVFTYDHGFSGGISHNPTSLSTCSAPSKKGEPASRGKLAKHVKRARRSQPKVAELERMKQDVEQRLRALSIENRKLRLRDQMMKELLDTIDEVDAFKITPTQDLPQGEGPIAVNDAAEVMRLYAEWETQIQALGRDVYALERAGLSPAQQEAVAQQMSQRFGCWIRSFWPTSQQQITLLLAMLMARGQKALKIPEEQHWDTVAASLHLTPEQRERALMLREILLSGALWPSPPSFIEDFPEPLVDLSADANVRGLLNTSPVGPPFSQPPLAPPFQNAAMSQPPTPPAFPFHPSSLSATQCSTAMVPLSGYVSHPLVPSLQPQPPLQHIEPPFPSQLQHQQPLGCFAPGDSDLLHATGVDDHSHLHISSVLEAAEIAELVQAVENPSAIKGHLEDVMKRLAVIFRSGAVVGRYTCTKILTPLQSLHFQFRSYPLHAMAYELLNAVARMPPDPDQ